MFDAANTAVTRVNLFAFVHKGLRAWMGHVLALAGCIDGDDEDDTARAIAEVHNLLAACREHQSLEEDFIHAAMQARDPGSAATSAAEHEHHSACLTTLEANAHAVLAARGQKRLAAARGLYRRLALFMADQLAHMDAEETHDNAVLWAHYDDAELLEIQGRLVASIAPETLAAFLRWMVPAATPAERAALLGSIQRNAARQTFERALALIRPYLSARDWFKVTRALTRVPLAA
jgi:hypothetical protein